MEKILIQKMLEMRKNMATNDAPNIALQKNETEVKIDTYRYINDNNPLHLLNIYSPINNNHKLPLLIDIHGGGWVYGDKDLNGLLCMDFAKKGFIVMSMSYSLLPENKLIDAIHDIFASLHYLYTLKDQHLIDFNNVAIMGDSAGGHLNLLVNAINSSDFLQSCFNERKLPFSIKTIIANHPAPYIHNPVNDSSLDEAYLNISYGENRKDLPFFPYVSMEKFGQYLNKNTEILIIASKYDNVVLSQAFDLAKQLHNENIPFDFYFEKSETSWHVYNVTQPFRDISKKCNDYIKQFIIANFNK